MHKDLLQKSNFPLVLINTYVTTSALVKDKTFRGAGLSAVTRRRRVRGEELLALLGHHSAVNLEAVIQVSLRVKFKVGAECSVSRGRSVEDASNPGVHQRHGAHDARLPGDVQVVAGADVGLRGLRLEVWRS